MEKKISWDDIPSLQLEIDDDDTFAESRDNRAAVRLSAQDFLKMLKDNVKIIHVLVANRKGVLKKKGILQDINQGGLSFIMPTHGLRKNEEIKIATMLGKKVFQTKAIVRWVTKDRVGIEYVNPSPEDIDFLAELYAAKVLNRVK